MTQNNQIQWLLNAATAVLTPVSDSARLDAELLLCFVLQCDRTYLFTWPDKQLNTDQIEQFESLLTQREQGRPIAHLIGERDFWSLSLTVNNSTLIPRPDTEVLVETALDICLTLGETSKQGLDLGTGTGAIALALASELPNWHFTGVDLVPEAVELAQVNQTKNGLNNCTFIQSKWFSNLNSNQYDLIVSNPPYIDKDDPHLSQGDVRFEPLTALVAADKGLADIKTIVDLSRQHLAKNGALLIEHGFQQGADVVAIFVHFGYTKVKTIKDLSGNDRVTVGYLK